MSRVVELLFLAYGFVALAREALRCVVDIARGRDSLRRY